MEIGLPVPSPLIPVRPPGDSCGKAHSISGFSNEGKKIELIHVPMIRPWREGCPAPLSYEARRRVDDRPLAPLADRFSSELPFPPRPDLGEISGQGGGTAGLLPPHVRSASIRPLMESIQAERVHCLPLRWLISPGPAFLHPWRHRRSALCGPRTRFPPRGFPLGRRPCHPLSLFLYFVRPGCSEAWSSRLLWEQKTAGSNPAIPTMGEDRPGE